MYAVVNAGGRQHKVAVGQTFEVEKMAAAEGETVTLDQVLLVGDDDATTIGRPLVEGARVLATVVDPDARGEKLIVFKYKPKVRYRRKKGHRQHYTKLKVTEIVPGAESTPAALAGAARQVGRAVGRAAAKAAKDAVETAKDALPGGDEEEKK